MEDVDAEGNPVCSARLSVFINGQHAQTTLSPNTSILDEFETRLEIGGDRTADVVQDEKE